jgi:hypothetical protein
MENTAKDQKTKGFTVLKTHKHIEKEKENTGHST